MRSRWCEKAAYHIDRITHPVGNILQGIGSALLIAMMLLTASDVILRYIFNRPIIGSFELTEFMMSIFIAFAFVTCALQKSHVAIDLIVNRLPQKLQFIAGGITSLLSIFILTLLTWQSFVYIKLQYNSHVVSTSLLIPRYPFIAFLCLAFGFLVVIYLSNLFNYMSELMKWQK